MAWPSAKTRKRVIRVFQVFVVEHKAFDDVFAQLLRGPDAKPRGHGAFDPVAHGNDGVEVVKINPPLNRTPALQLNCQGFLDSCRTVQLLFIKDVLQVQADILPGRLKKLGHVLLGQPNRLVFQLHVQPGAAVLGLVEDDF
jgi:hypothetical protein